MSIDPRSGSTTARRVDVLALVTLWLSVGGAVDWSVVKIVAPLLLVVVGVAGLALSRRT